MLPALILIGITTGTVKALQPGDPGWNTSVLSTEDASAAELAGDPYAMAVISTYAALGWNWAKDPVTAWKLASSSAQVGDPLGMFRLGALLRAGVPEVGIEKDDNRGIELQRSSFGGLNRMAGNPYAMTAVAIMLFRGEIVDKDIKEAVRLYRAAADMGYAPAQYNYALCCLEGNGISKSPATYEEYLRKAADSGYPDAIESLVKNRMVAIRSLANGSEEAPAVSYYAAQLGKEPIEVQIAWRSDKSIQGEIVFLNDRGNNIPIEGENQTSGEVAIWNSAGATTKICGILKKEIVAGNVEWHGELLVSTGETVDIALVKKTVAPAAQSSSNFITSAILTKTASEPPSTSNISTVVQRSPDPASTSACAVNEQGTLLCTVEGGMVCLWELPSGRFIKEYQAPYPAAGIFFRGDDLMLSEDSMETTEGAGFKTINFINAITGTKSRSPLTIPGEVRVESFSEKDDVLLLFDRDSRKLSLFNIGSNREAQSFNWEGNSDFYDYAFSIFHENLIVSFGGEDADGAQPVDNYVCFDVDGKVIERGQVPDDTSQEDYEAMKKNMFEKLAARLNLPTAFFSTDYFSNREGGIDDSGNDTNQLSLFRSIQKWGACSANFIVNLHEPSTVWISNLSTLSKTLIIPGQRTSINTHLAVDPDQRRYFTWNMESFLNRDKRSQPYYLDLSTITWQPVTLPEDTTVLNAAMTGKGALAICFGAYRPGPDPEENDYRIPELAVSRCNVEFGQQPEFANVLGNIHPYMIELDLNFFPDFAMNAAREVLSIQSDEDVRNRLTQLSKKHLSDWMNQRDDNIETVALSDGRMVRWRSYDSIIKITEDNLPDQVLELPQSERMLDVIEIKGVIVLATTATYTSGALYSIDHGSLEVQDTFPINAGEFRESIGFSVANSEIYVNDGETTIIVNVSNDGKFSSVATIKQQVDGAPIITFFDNFYLRFSQTVEGVHFSDGVKTYPLEQFDLRLNRPDLAIARLGGPPEAVAIAKELRDKRLKRMGVTEDMLKPDFHLPEVELMSSLPTSTQSRTLTLQIKAEDSKYLLDRLIVYVNNVPVNGANGESLRSLNVQSLEREILVTLAVGKNKIQVSVINSAGAESLYATGDIICSVPAPKPNLYVVAIGVSNYENQQFNLKYAAKDAEDLAEKLKSCARNSYGEVKALVLTDEAVTKDALPITREFLSAATVDDSVVIFMAGHGLLDEKYDYYFGTNDIDFEHPSAQGISFDDMDDLLAKVPSLKKMLLMDTCHAGELDDEEKARLAAAASDVQIATNSSVTANLVGTRGMAIKGIWGARGKGEWYERIATMFVDLRRGSGSTILSSSAGTEYAFEGGQQKNGLFTYAVLEALDGAKGADADRDGTVTVDELCERVKKRVAELSDAKQTPNTRRVNMEANFPLSLLETP